MKFFCRQIRPLTTKPAELNVHSTGTEAADEDKWNGNCVVLLKAKSKQKLPLLPV